jgi:multidrug transporter EmrE-like cation transporter
LQASGNLTNWSKNWAWATGFFVFLFLSMYLLNEAAKHIPMGTCYAVWTGIGTVGTALVGISKVSTHLFGILGKIFDILSK